MDRKLHYFSSTNITEGTYNNTTIRILNNLSSKERTIFYRKYYYMQSTSQIAREMGISNRAAEGKLYRIKQKIRKQMGGWQDE